ncbi:MAG TPA: flagellar protein FlaG [Methylophilus sp.]|nr:flagellar protein FlaG [Methylophilus sp.]HQQ34294.1 flagellar protein FlaG [Methylophilus sp.]
MSIQSMNTLTGGVVQPGGYVPAPSTTSRKALPVEVKAVEVKEVATSDQLQKAVEDANEVFRQINSDVQFVVDKESNKVVIKLVEHGSGEVINQYPTEQALAISKAIAQMQSEIVERHAAFKAADSGLAGLMLKQKT